MNNNNYYYYYYYYYYYICITYICIKPCVHICGCILPSCFILSILSAPSFLDCIQCSTRCPLLPLQWEVQRRDAPFFCHRQCWRSSQSGCHQMQFYVGKIMMNHQIFGCPILKHTHAVVCNSVPGSWLITHYRWVEITSKVSNWKGSMNFTSGSLGHVVQGRPP
jgi:hypothetical protein